MLEKIEWNGKPIALILRKGLESDGVHFFTPEDNPIQLGLLSHKKGTQIKPHIHKASPRTIECAQEVLHIQSGQVEVHLYSAGGKPIGSCTLNEGDTILLISGGHGLNMLEDSKIIEVKQGPYTGVLADKEYLNLNNK